MNTTIISNPEYPWAQSLAEHLATQGVPQEAVPIYQGRNTVYRLDWEGHKLCIKAFKKPGAINAVAYSTVRKSKAARSYLYALRLLQMGINTPAPLAYVEERSGLCLRRSYYVCEYVEGENIRNWHLLADQDAMLAALAEEMVKIHRAGVWHKDFSPGNILVQRPAADAYKFYLVDINRMQFGVYDRRLLRNFKNIHQDLSETLKLASLYARCASRNPDETCQLATKYYHGFHRKKQFLKRLKPRRPSGR